MNNFSKPLLNHRVSLLFLDDINFFLKVDSINFSLKKSSDIANIPHTVQKVNIILKQSNQLALKNSVIIHKDKYIIDTYFKLVY